MACRTIGDYFSDIPIGFAYTDSYRSGSVSNPLERYRFLIDLSGNNQNLSVTKICKDDSRLYRQLSDLISSFKFPIVDLDQASKFLRLCLV